MLKKTTKILSKKHLVCKNSFYTFEPGKPCFYLSLPSRSSRHSYAECTSFRELVGLRIAVLFQPIDGKLHWAPSAGIYAVNFSVCCVVI